MVGAGGGELRPGGAQSLAVEAGLQLVERAVDAGELLGVERVGGTAGADLGERAVVGLLVDLEGGFELVDDRAEVVG